MFRRLLVTTWAAARFLAGTVVPSAVDYAFARLGLYRVPDAAYKSMQRILHRDCAWILERQAFLYEVAGIPNRSLDCYRQLCELQPDRPGHYLDLGDTYYLKLGDRPNAVQAYRRYVEVERLRSGGLSEAARGKIAFLEAQLGEPLT